LQTNPTIGLEVKKVSHLFRQNLESRHTDLDEGITGPQRMVLHYLAECAGSREVFQKDIETAFSIRRSSVTGVLQLMEKNGLITRESVPTDARLKKLILTSTGIALHQKAKDDIRATEEKALRGLEAAEIDQLFFLLEKVRNNLECN